MSFRTILFVGAVLLAAGAAHAQIADTAGQPVLRMNVTVSGDIVRIGDVIDNAGAASGIAIYRAPDLGTIGRLQISQIIATLRTHNVIGVDTRGASEITVTRETRTLVQRDVELSVARALERRNGLGDAAGITVTFDRDLRQMQIDPAFSGEMQPVAVRFDTRGNRFDITFDIAHEKTSATTRLRFTGTAVETVDAAVLVRSIERNEIIKASDVVIERRAKSEVGFEAATRERAIGMQARKAIRAGSPVRMPDLAKADLVQRDQSVTLIYETAGLYLTMRGKALEGGTEGDTVNVLNLQSKRTVQGLVVGPGQVSIISNNPRLSAGASGAMIAANKTSVSPTVE